MFELKLMSIVFGALLHIVFFGLIVLAKTRKKFRTKPFARATAFCLILGATLVLIHSVLARDVVLFVGQLVAGIMLYRWLVAAGSTFP